MQSGIFNSVILVVQETRPLDNNHALCPTPREKGEVSFVDIHTSFLSRTRVFPGYLNIHTTTRKTGIPHLI